MTRNMTPNQKKYLSLFLAVAIVTLVSLLTGCGNKAEQEQEQKQQQEAVKKFTHQGDGTVRKAGEKGQKAF